MNVDSKKTVLNDEASIYQKRKNEYSTNDMKNMSGKEKWDYFKEYYMKKVLIVLAVIIFICMFVRDVIMDKSECLLNVAFMQECQVVEYDDMKTSLEEYLGFENEDEFVSINNYNLENAQVNMSFSTLVASGSIDVVICPYEYFKEASAEGIFADLSEVMPKEMYNELSDKLLISRTEEVDYEDNVTYGEELPYGIDISDSSVLKEVSDYEGQAVICVLLNAPNKVNSIKTISYFTESK